MLAYFFPLKFKIIYKERGRGERERGREGEREVCRHYSSDVVYLAEVHYYQLLFKVVVEKKSYIMGKIKKRLSVFNPFIALVP